MRPCAAANDFPATSSLIRSTFLLSSPALGKFHPASNKPQKFASPVRPAGREPGVAQALLPVARADAFPASNPSAHRQTPIVNLKSSIANRKLQACATVKKPEPATVRTALAVPLDRGRTFVYIRNEYK
jgi:hypothetical protein